MWIAKMWIVERCRSSIDVDPREMTIACALSSARRAICACAPPASRTPPQTDHHPDLKDVHRMPRFDNVFSITTASSHRPAHD
jgi:hypothetical protein